MPSSAVVELLTIETEIHQINLNHHLNLANAVTEQFVNLLRLFPLLTYATVESVCILKNVI